MIGKTVSHYKIIENLGQGGMGIVYKAQDLKLDRFVALKFLPPHLTTSSEEKQRFIHEAKAASTLQHNNICAIHEIDETEDGQIFICMDYYEGETLNKKIKEKPLSLEDTIDISIQIAQGLTKAHQKEIVHRDIKPANIMLTNDGVVKILDFGLAKLSTQTKLTKEGSTIGTIAYMSPEQARGEEVDFRTDIWSLGVILYEMLSGQLPFKGNYDQAVVYSIINEDPEPLTALRSGVSMQLEQIINKALSKSPDERYQHVDELVIDLKRLKKADESFVEQPIAKQIIQKSPAKGITPFIIPAAIVLIIIVVFLLVRNQFFSKEQEPVPIAVISFENLTGDESYNYLRKAIPNLLITNLEQSQYFRVLTWERMHDMLKNLGKNKTEIIDRELGFEICRIEGIPALVTGSFVQAGETFATDVKIVDVKTKNLLKSANTKGDGVASILKEQIDELSREISHGIGISENALTETARPIAEVTTTSLEAYNYFLRGREEYEKGYSEDAAQFLEQAINLDTTFAVAYLYLSRVYYSLGNTIGRDTSLKRAKSLTGNVTDKERLYIEATYASIIERNPEKRFSILKTIVSKYPMEKRAYSSLGYYYASKKLYDMAIQNFEHAITLDPDYGSAFNGLAYTYISLGNFEKAIEYLKRYASVSPADADPFDSMGDLYFRMGKLNQALEKYKEAIAVKPNFISSHFKMAYITALQENYLQAIKLLDHLVLLYPGPERSTGGAGAIATRSFLKYWSGNQDAAWRDIEEAVDKWKSVSNLYFISVSDFAKAWFYLDEGQVDRGLDCMKRWYDFILQYFPASTAYNTERYNFYLGLKALQQGRIDSSQSYLDKMKLLLPEIAPGSIEEIGYYMNVLQAELLLAEGEIEKAIIVYKETKPYGISSTNAPVLVQHNFPFIFPSLRDGLARAYLRLGETDKAISEYERLITFDPDGKDRHLIHPEYHYQLAALYEEKGLSDNAIDQYEKFLDIWKNADEDLVEFIDAKKRLAKLKKEM